VKNRLERVDVLGNDARISNNKIVVGKTAV